MRWWLEGLGGPVFIACFFKMGAAPGRSHESSKETGLQAKAISTAVGGLTARMVGKRGSSQSNKRRGWPPAEKRREEEVSLKGACVCHTFLSCKGKLTESLCFPEGKCFIRNSTAASVLIT